MLPLSRETELLCRLSEGDRSAFQELYHAYMPAVYANALKLTRDTATAQDVVQEVFITLWEKRLTLDGNRPVGGWLFTICFNRSVNVLRKKLREGKAIRHWTEPVEVSGGELLYNAQRQLLEDAMAQLSPQKRKVFELCKLQGKTYEETAASLQISKYTVKEYLSASQSFIREYVQRQPASPLL